MENRKNKEMLEILDRYKKNKINIDMTDIVKMNILKMLFSIMKDLEFLGEITSQKILEDIFNIIENTNIKNNELEDFENILNIENIKGLKNGLNKN